MHKLKGQCHCGNVRVEIELVRSPETYNPRACDCDFCSKHAAAYVSDPQGSLLMQIRDDAGISRYRQGSGAAECIVCRNCGVLAGVLFVRDGRTYGAVNARIMDGPAGFGVPQCVSPKNLAVDEKVERWRNIWFPDVTLTSTSHENGHR